MLLCSPAQGIFFLIAQLAFAQAATLVSNCFCYKSEQKSANLERQIQDLQQFVNNLNNELVALKNKFIEQQIGPDAKVLLDECVEDILGQRFKAAEEKINLISDDNKVNYIVHKAYGNKTDNFDLILEFGRSFTENKRKFLILKALSYEMEADEHTDFFNVTTLVESLQINIINQANTPSDIKRKSESVVNNLKQLAKSIATEKLSNGMLNDRYALVGDVADKLLRFDEKLFADVMKEVVNNVTGKISLEEILSNIHNHSYITQIILGYQAVSDYMLNTGLLYSHGATFRLAFYIKEVMGFSYYSKLSQETKSILESLKERLPKSVKNAIFLSKVCIKNVKFNEYLYAADDDLSFNQARRRVFTWISGGNDSQSVWKIEPNAETVLIKNNQFNEYFYAAHFNSTSDKRHVFTWKPKDGKSSDQYHWKIEPLNDKVYIKSEPYKDYLSLWFDDKYDTYRRSPFNWMPGTKLIQSEWAIEDCIHP